MNIFSNQPGFSRFETMLGVALLASVVLFVLPPLQVGVETERPLRTEMEAETLARAVLDYHTDTGRWPMKGDGQTDLSLLVPAHNKARTRAMATTMNSATEGIMMGTMVSSGTSETVSDSPEKTWLKEVPVDPWDRPFRVVIMGDRTSVAPAGNSSTYPDEPPAGTSIVVISAGPNGLYDTDLAQFWSGGLSSRITRQGQDDASGTDNSFGGDDLGYVLSRSVLGGQ